MAYTTKVLLRGVLGEKFGHEWNLALDQGNPMEAWNAISRQRPGMRQWVMDAAQDGVGLRVLIGGKDTDCHGAETFDAYLDYELAEEEERAEAGERLRRCFEDMVEDLHAPCGKSQIEFVAEPMASGISMAAIMMAARIAYVIAQIAMIAYSIYKMATAKTPSPSSSPLVRMEDYQAAEVADERGSYAFSGAVNKRGIGKPLPLLFGRGIVGSHVGSFGIRGVQNRAPRNMKRRR